MCFLSHRLAPRAIPSIIILGGLGVEGLEFRERESLNELRSLTCGELGRRNYTY
jgi:hypothetical protein